MAGTEGRASTEGTEGMEGTERTEGTEGRSESLAALAGDGLEAVDLCVDLGSDRILKNLNLHVKRGETMALLGPSGCGKTTFLRAVAGLQRLHTGKVLWEGEDLAPIPPHRRRFGMVFQDHALLPHRSAGENVAFGLKMMGMPVKQRRRRAGEMLDLVDLPGYENRSVSTLSGGEAQRVALARSLAPQPRLLLLDEPFAALDRPLQEKLIADIRRILKERKQTAVGVTHDHAEAFALADRVALMRRGKIHRIGTPRELRDDPRDVFTASFLSLGAVWSPEKVCFEADGSLKTPWGPLRLPQDVLAANSTPKLLIRPEAVTLTSDGQPAKITNIQLISGRNLATIEAAGAPPIGGYVGNEVSPGMRCSIKLDVREILLLE